MAGILPARNFVQQPQQVVPCGANGLQTIAAYNAALGFVDCTGVSLTRGSAAAHSASLAGVSLNATALNTSIYRAITPPASGADYVLIWHGVFVGNPTGTSAKILGIAKSTTSQSDDLISIERGSTNDTIYINARSGTSPILREALTVATSWYGKKVTIVARYSVSKVVFDLYVCVEGAVTIYPLALSGPALPTIFGTEQFVVGADVIESPSRFANVKTSLGYVGVGSIDQVGLISLVQNPWQVFAFPQKRFGVSFSGGAYTLTAQAGTYTAAGQNAQLRKSKLLNTFGGAYALSGSTANILRNRKLTSSGGAYLATGSDASLYRSRQLSLTGGSYNISGASATITFTGLSANFTLTAQGGIYSLSGSAAGITYTPLSAAYMLVAQGGVYSVTGNSASVKKSKLLISVGGAYTYTGRPVNITAGPAVISNLVRYINVLTGEVMILKPF